MPTIHQRIEKSRGCGYRKKGGIYLVSGGAGRSCGKLPVPLTVCPCCNEGIKQTRGYRWVNSRIIAGSQPCSFIIRENSPSCTGCPLNGVFDKDVMMGLLWVGEKFYASPDIFVNEANDMGVSRRIAQVPKDFVVGETWIALAHKEAVCYPLVGESGTDVHQPGVFYMFKPTAIEYVVRGNETEDDLERLEKRGFTLVNVIPDKGNSLDGIL